MNPMVVRKIGEQVGMIEEIDVGKGGSCVGQFARVRVCRPLEKPLQRCVNVEDILFGESKLILLLYEKLLNFCYALMGGAIPVARNDGRVVRDDPSVEVREKSVEESNEGVGELNEGGLVKNTDTAVGLLRDMRVLEEHELTVTVLEQVGSMEKGKYSMDMRCWERKDQLIKPLGSGYRETIVVEEIVRLGEVKGMEIDLEVRGKGKHINEESEEAEGDRARSDPRVGVKGGETRLNSMFKSLLFIVSSSPFL
ncbi:hypothetical protein C2S52_017697 [Perilla frutescens var. hirtella]|nr:hypothetical protein C2S52_017697 [Perilla frutescens var. hirtella]